MIGKTVLYSTLICASSLALAQTASALSPDTTDPDVIMRAVETRDSGNATTLKLHITIEDDAGRQRSRKMHVRSMEFDEGAKQIVLFEEPADLRNAGMLSVDYHDGSKTDDQWLYLPSLGRTTRIASADKSGSFMGTDLTYSDMTKKDPEAYSYTMVEQSTSVDGEDCWLIEATPKTDKEKSETGYMKSHVWVSKDKMVPLQLKAWVLEGKRLKYTKMSDIRSLDGIWVAHKVVVRTKRGSTTESTSTLTTSDMVMNASDVSETDFTEQRLERGL